MRRNLLDSLSDNIVIDKDKCTFCGICVERCILDNLRMKLAPCRQACPLGVNCHGYVQLIARGDELEAMKILRETLPFPGILGRICSQPCEAKCYRNTVDGSAVAVRSLKRYLADNVDERQIAMPETAESSRKVVAVIGSGPAGLMAAYDLRRKGHGVSVFDKEISPGGMLRWAIPEFRLPVAVLEKELNLLIKLGVVFRHGVVIGKDKSIEELKRDFHAVVVATGCPTHFTLPVDGENLAGVYYGLPFLRQVRRGRLPAVGKKAIVIGAGNVAVDVAQTVLRLGAEQVTMVCLESDAEIPAFPWALESALSEGVKLECCWGPLKFTSQNGVVTGVEFQRCLQVYDAFGAFQPILDSCELLPLEADTVVVAIGQNADTGLLHNIGLKSETLDPVTLQTADEVLFMAGDVIGGPTSVVEAMANGRKAAESVDRFLKGENLHYGRTYDGPVETEFEIDTSNATLTKRINIAQHQHVEPGDFTELEAGIDMEAARREAKRCLSCGQPYGKYRTCWFCLPCEVDCPHTALWVEVPYLLR